MDSDKSEADRRREFATLWAESYDRVRTYVRVFVPSLHDSEDVIQETALAIAKDFDKYDAQRPFLEWAIGIARNRVHQYFRKRGRDKQMVFDLDTIRSIEKGFLAVESRFDDYRDALDDCLQRLPARSRRLIHARYLAGMNGDEIANQVGLTVQSVYTRLSQIRLGLRDCIKRRLRLHGEEA